MTTTELPPTPSKKDYTTDPAYQAILAANEVPIMGQENPFTLFDAWMAEARASEPSDANAMSLATIDDSGMPDLRVVLLKGVSPDGFVFYSHQDSAKGRELKSNPKAALNFHWKSLRRQVRVRGAVEEVSREMVAAYFATRARNAQIGAWASQQSKTLEHREDFKRELAAMEEKYAGKPVPVPTGWSGWRVMPEVIEFWRDRPFRLHDRLVFEKNKHNNDWQTKLLYP